MDFLYLLEGIRTPFLTAVLSAVTYLGHELFVIGIVCALLWCVDKNLGYRLGLIFFLSGLGLQLTKIICRIPRPWVIDPNFKPVESAVPAATGYSFPSGHTQGATALFLPLALTAKNEKKRIILTVVAVLLSALVAFSRMYLGVHTPKDVAVGAAMSVVALLVMTPLVRVLERKTKYDIFVSAVLICLSVATMAVAISLYSNGTIDEYKMAADCCKSAASGLAFAIGWYVERRYIHYEVKCDKLYKQFLKVAIGAAGALLFKESFKLIFGVNFATDIIRYFLTVIWVVAVFPYIWMKLPFSGVKKAENDSAKKI